MEKSLPSAHRGAYLFSPQVLPSATPPTQLYCTRFGHVLRPPSPPSLCTPSQQCILRSLFLHTLNSLLLWDLDLQTHLSTSVNSTFSLARRVLSAVPLLTPRTGSHALLPPPPSFWNQQPCPSGDDLSFHSTQTHLEMVRVLLQRPLLPLMGPGVNSVFTPRLLH